jgi:hypothetical protein
MEPDPPTTGARLLFKQDGMYEEDDSVLGWELPDGRTLVEVRGDAPRQVLLRAGDTLLVEVRQGAGYEDTTLSLERDDARTRLATGGIAMTAGGLHGPTLAAQLRAAAERCGCAVQLVVERVSPPAEPTR